MTYIRVFCSDDHSCKFATRLRNHGSTNDSPLYSPAQQVFPVRHAERFDDYESPPLTVQGKERAEALSRYAARCRCYRNQNFTVATGQRHRAAVSRPA